MLLLYYYLQRQKTQNCLYSLNPIICAINGHTSKLILITKYYYSKTLLFIISKLQGYDWF